MKGKIQYKESQSFRNTWMFYVVMGVAGLSMAGAMIPLWAKPGENEVIIAMIIVVIVCLGLVLLLGLAKLETVIDDRAVYYRFPPFVNREHRLTQEDISEIYVRKYRPIWEYGGWGYRIRPGKGKALNVSGNIGLQIILKNGKALLIGTAKREELERAVRRLKENWELNG